MCDEVGRRRPILPGPVQVLAGLLCLQNARSFCRAGKRWRRIARRLHPVQLWRIPTCGLMLIFSILEVIFPAPTYSVLGQLRSPTPWLDLEAHLILASTCTPISRPAGYSLSHIVASHSTRWIACRKRVPSLHDSILYYRTPERSHLWKLR